VDILKHGRDTLTLDDVIGILNSKELQQKVEGENTTRDVLAVRFRMDKRDPKSRGRSWSKSRNGRKVIQVFIIAP